MKILRSLLIVVALLLGSNLSAQHTGTSFTLNQPITGGQHSYTATDYIKLMPGFRYLPQGSGDYFKAIAEQQQVQIPSIQFLEQQISSNRQLNTSLEVGTIEGDFYIDVNGNSTYRIPLMIPPGVKEMKPSVSIDYKSTINSSYLGIGWQLNASSMISRTGASLFYDGVSDGITLTSADKFLLDGERLIVVNGNYGFPASEYRTANESFKKITITEHENGQPISFKIETKEGLKKYYGINLNSRTVLNPEGKILNWLLSRIEDNQGNYIQYYYLHDENVSYVERIEYTGNSRNEISPPNQILFRYGRHEDYKYSYIQSNRIHMNLLLTDIETKHEGQSVLNYHFDYYYNNKPFLNQIELIDKDGNRYNSTIFNYNDDMNQYSGLESFYVKGLPELMYPYVNGGETKRITKSMLNNGICDFISINDNTPDYQNRQHNKLAIGLWKSSYNNEPQLAYSHLFQKPEVFNKGLLDVILFGDFQGDGLQDMFISLFKTYNDYELHYFLQDSDGDNFSNFLIEESLFAPTTQNHEIFIGDFMGLGRDQILIIENLDSYKETENLGSNNTLKLSIIDLKTQEIFQSNFEAGISVTTESTGYRYVLADINGNHKKDIIIFNTDGFFVLELTGHSLNSTDLNIIFSGQSPTVFDKVYSCKLNLDNMEDLIFFHSNSASWNTMISMGTGFEESGISSMNPHHPEMNSHIFVDLDGDGLTDIVDMGYPSGTTPQDWLPQSIKVFYSQGNGYFSEQNINLSSQWGNLFYSYINVNDFDGNGALELLYYSSGPSTSCVIPTNINSKKSLLTAISDGLNFRTLISYEPMPQSNHVLKTSAKLGENYYIEKAPVFITTSRINQKNGSELKQEFYYYFDPVFNAQEKSFLGYSKTRFELQKGEEIQNEFQVFPNINRLLLKEVKEFASDYFAQGELLKSTAFTYNFYSSFPGVVFNYPFQIVKTNHFKKMKEMSTNLYSVNDINSGNVTQSIKYRYLKDVLIETKTVDFLYTNSGSWCQNKTRQIDIRFSKPEQQDIVRQTQFFYNMDVNHLGLLNRTIYNSNLTNPVTIAINEYDTFGNPLTISKSGNDFISSVLSYSYNNSGTFIASKTNQLSQTDLFDFDFKFGNINSITDAKGLQSSFDYDGFGRLKSQTNPIGIIAEKEYIWNDTFLGSVYHTSTTAPGQGEVLEYFDQTQDIIGRGKQDKNGQFFYEMYQYNSYGKILKISEPTYDHAKNDIQWTEYHYDQYNRLEGITSIGKNESFDYIDNTIITTNNLTGSITTKTYDPSFKLISVSEDVGNLITYDYNAEGQIKKVQMNNTSFNYTYDENGNLSSYSDQSSSGNSSILYNSIGQLLTATDANGNFKQLSYDLLGRKETERLNNEIVANYIYDCNQNSIGELCSIHMADNQSVFYQYDEYGRMIMEKEMFENQEMQFEYSYNSNSLLSNVRFPNGLEINYLYNEIGFLEGLKKNQSADFIYKVNEYDLYNRATSFDYGNSISTLKGYDETTHLIENIDVFPKNQSNAFLFSISYTPHPSRNLLMDRKDNLRNLSEEFLYDNYSRLTNINGVNGVPSSFMEYQSNGNIIENNEAFYDYLKHDAHHAVSQLTTKAGSQIPLSQQAITYNTHNNKVESITEGEYEYFLKYDVLSQRKQSKLFENGNLIKTKRYFHNFEVINNSATYYFDVLGIIITLA
ncbi:MAG: SpvB/TcaC N-terminal domain-containing protein [Bacteroidales bacterium]|nr:SpvB/TcaC N-terminal domain-containing protein [Bacteroidales bacterium]